MSNQEYISISRRKELIRMSTNYKGESLTKHEHEFIKMIALISDVKGIVNSDHAMLIFTMKRLLKDMKNGSSNEQAENENLKLMENLAMNNEVVTLKLKGKK